MTVPHPYDLLTEDENKVIFKTRDLRLQIIDNFIEEKGIPSRSGDIRVLNELMNSLDGQVLGMTDRRLKKEENNTNDNMLDVVKEVISNVQANLAIPSEKKLDIEDKFVPVDVVPGEVEIEYNEIDPSEVLGSDDT